MNDFVEKRVFDSFVRISDSFLMRALLNRQLIGAFTSFGAAIKIADFKEHSAVSVFLGAVFLVVAIILFVCYCYYFNRRFIKVDSLPCHMINIPPKMYHEPRFPDRILLGIIEIEKVN